MDATGWVMAVHIVTLGTWSAALLILAGLYASAPLQLQRTEVQRHRVMCRYVFIMLASPAAILAIVSGSALVYLRGAEGMWLPAKLTVVALLALYHAFCGKVLDKQGMEARQLRLRRHHPSLITVPLALIAAIFLLVLTKPDMVFEYQLSPQPAGHRHQDGAEQGQVQPAASDRLQRLFQAG